MVKQYQSAQLLDQLAAQVIAVGQRREELRGCQVKIGDDAKQFPQGRQRGTAGDAADVRAAPDAVG